MYKSKFFFLSCFAMLSGCDNYNIVNGSESHSQLKAANGTFITGLPPNAVAGDIYPVAFAASVDHRLDQNAATLIEAENMTIESSSVDCLSLESDEEHLCTVSLRVKPTNKGNTTVSLNIGGERYSNTSKVNDSAIVGYVNINNSQSFGVASEMLELGRTYPLELVFVNIGEQQATNVSIESLNGSILSNVKNTCGTTLAAGTACYIYGEYQPTKQDATGVQYELTYDEGAAVLIGANNIAPETKLMGRTVSALPLNIGVDVSYDVEFEFKNLGTDPLTNLETQLLASSSKSEIRFDSCQGATLAAGESCSLTTSITAEHIGTLTALAAVYGDQGIISYASVASNAVESPIVGDVQQDLPQNMAIDAPYNYLVTFTNYSKSHDATGVKFAHLYPESYTILSDTCTNSTLRAEESCHISGTTSAKTPGVQRYSSYLSFDQGTAVIASSTLSQASERAIESKIDVNFPSNMVLNHSYPFHVTFTNTGAIDTDVVEISSATLDGVTIDYNTCENILAPGASCQLSGEFYTTQLGPVRLEGSLNYGATSDEIFSVSGEVVPVPIEGFVKVGLPQNIGLNNTYPISYIYRNLSDSHDANMLDVTLSSTAPVHVITNSCASTKTLHAGEECEIAGEFTANEQGQHQFLSSLRYKEGNEVKIQSSAMVSEVVVSSQVEGSLPIVGLGQNYPIRYRFNNESAVEASGIKVSHSTNLNITSNSCGTTLDAGNQCEIVAEYRPSQNGQFAHTLNFEYVEGNDISLTQSVKVVDAIVLDEVVYQDGELSHTFDARDYFNYGSEYGFTILSKLQTLNISGNPERVVYAQWGGTDMDIELTPSAPMIFRAHRVNNCSTRSMNSYIGCQSGKLPSFRLTLHSDSFNALATGEQSGVIYINLTQSNNTHVALFMMPIRVIKL
ncbi:hypothetical protein AKJ18_10775 [Vibrio xuii]|nr:hypothetical protein AKJ18_10775 [Vibrio xuii]